MTRMTTLLLLVLASYTSSCTSEYEERLSQGLYLKQKLATMEQSAALMESGRFNEEIEEIHDQINLLAKVSGNEELFLQQIYGVQSSSSWFGSQK